MSLRLLPRLTGRLASRTVASTSARQLSTSAVRQRVVATSPVKAKEVPTTISGKYPLIEHEVSMRLSVAPAGRSKPGGVRPSSRAITDV
ncbi:BQ5605_C012g07002 [Microbotryum silenes-dioicae]|uniref:BQ5605_C012g07002 protein n=1 Tax=Microbotryum silenes-dioicae TaxID=796604 RepID=A0A2X0LX40_9BASI|nr:BQ5605_C012g07002 [Microbotryum silenes-dioicae]